MMRIKLLLVFTLLAISVSDQHRFDAQKLIVLSDADMAASAYVDGRLLRVPGDQDELSLIDFSSSDTLNNHTTLPVSNSDTNWTKS